MIQVAEITYTATMMFGPVPRHSDDAWWYRTPHHVGIGCRLLGGAPRFEDLARPFYEYPEQSAPPPPPPPPPEPYEGLVLALGGITGRPDKHICDAHHQVGGHEQTFIREWQAHPGITVEEACEGMNGQPVKYTMTVHQDGTYVCEWMNGEYGRGEGESTSIITGKRNCPSWLKAVAAAL